MHQLARWKHPLLANNIPTMSDSDFNVGFLPVLGGVLNHREVAPLI